MTILDDIPMERNWTFSYVFKARSTRNPDIFETAYIFFYPDSCGRSPATKLFLVSSRNAPRGEERCVTIKTTSVADYSVDAILNQSGERLQKYPDSCGRGLILQGYE